MLSPFRQLHFDATVFGDDAQEFKFDRFLGTENAGLVKGKSFRPFGGGPTYCPGRFVAKQEVFMFVATVLARFNLSTTTQHTTGSKKEEGQAFPRLDRKKPSLGVMGPVAKNDFLVHVTPR